MTFKGIHSVSDKDSFLLKGSVGSWGKRGHRLQETLNTGIETDSEGKKNIDSFCISGVSFPSLSDSGYGLHSTYDSEGIKHPLMC